MEKNNKEVEIESKQNVFVTVIIVIAVVVFAFGVYIAFFPIYKWGINFSNDGFVSAIFSLIGAVLFFGALVYQIKEYQNQLEELKLSVKAQTASSIALQEQKEIMLQANNRELILSLIDKLIEFAEINKIEQLLKDNIFYAFPVPHRNKLITYKKPDNNEVDIDNEIIRYFQSFKDSFFVQNEEYRFIIRSYIIQIEGILSLVKKTKHLDEKYTLTHLLLSNLKPHGITFYLSWRMNKMSFNNISFEWQKTATANLFKYMKSNHPSYQTTPRLESEWINVIDKILKKMFIEQNILVIYEEKDYQNQHIFNKE